MTQENLTTIKEIFQILSRYMKERDEDCANPKTMVDEGYSLAVRHMNLEIERIVSDLEKQVWPKSAENQASMIPKDAYVAMINSYGRPYTLPLEDYLEREAYRYGYESYEALKADRMTLDWLELVTKEGLPYPDKSIKMTQEDITYDRE